MARYIYRVVDLDADGAEAIRPRFVEARSKAAALAHVASQRFSIRACNKSELADALRFGVRVEEASIQRRMVRKPAARKAQSPA